MLHIRRNFCGVILMGNIGTHASSKVITPSGSEIKFKVFTWKWKLLNFLDNRKVIESRNRNVNSSLF